MVRRTILFNSILTFLLFFSLPPVTQSGTSPQVNQLLLDQPIIVEKAADPLPLEVKSFLAERDSETAVVWLFFTDKGVTDKAGFDAKAASVRLTERAMKRRAKVGLDHVVFADLPVERNYLDQVTAMGGTLRRQSKWLNAASFEIPASRLDAVSQLPFVASVRPVARYKKPIEFDERLEMSGEVGMGVPADQTKSPVDLVYGNSWFQLNEINVPAVHAKGIFGEGVLLAIFDTGFSLSHVAFYRHLIEGRLLGTYDFVYDDPNVENEPGEPFDPWYASPEFHGTGVWSIAGGEWPENLYGPAFKASFLLGKTEDTKEEYPGEEDNLVAGVEWADSLGADVMTASLGYSDWYGIRDMDGETSPCTIAFAAAAGLGIVACNSMGNAGPDPITLSAPSDADNILSVGAVNSEGVIAEFSSRGPTYDARTKPEVCARGVSTRMALITSDQSDYSGNGTSFSTPLVAGAACLMVQARPGFTPLQIRQAFMETADNADDPNNTYGCGIIDVDAAITWGPNITSDIQMAEPPFTVQFAGSSTLPTDSWHWSFGDGATSMEQSPTHEYTEPGVYDVSMTVETSFGELTDLKPACVLAVGDTLTFVSDSGFAGQSSVMSVHLINTQPLDEVLIPFRTENITGFKADSATLGERTAYFEEIKKIAADPYWTQSYTYRLRADIGGCSPLLPPGSGEIMKLYFSFDEWDAGGTASIIDTTSSPAPISFESAYVTYAPKVVSGTIKTITVARGDVDYTHQVDVADLVHMVNYSFNGGPPPVTQPSMDLNADSRLDVSDVVYMVQYQFFGGPPPQ